MQRTAEDPFFCPEGINFSSYIDIPLKKHYNNGVINNAIIDKKGGFFMAVKDHSLDDKIIRAAQSEFLKHGFQKASLHKIAELAGITTGAVYTRYKHKDAL